MQPQVLVMCWLVLKDELDSGSVRKQRSDCFWQVPVKPFYWYISYQLLMTLTIVDFPRSTFIKINVQVKYYASFALVFTKCHFFCYHIKLPAKVRSSLQLVWLFWKLQTPKPWNKFVFSCQFCVCYVGNHTELQLFVNSVFCSCHVHRLKSGYV